MQMKILKRNIKTPYLRLTSFFWKFDNYIRFIKTDPPMVSKLSQQDIIEGRDLSVTCTVTPGNPSSTIFYWTKIDNPGFRQNGSTLRLLNIPRNSSGVYMCSAENIYTNGENGIQNQTMVVNVLCEF